MIYLIRHGETELNAARVVQPADTLWAIAAERYGDPREGVYELQERNDLEGTTIVPGQVLMLP